MNLKKHKLILPLILMLSSFGALSADLNISTINSQGALVSTDLALQAQEELRNSDAWKEVAEELQAKSTEAREIAEKNQKEGPTMSEEDLQEAAKRFQSLQQDTKFLQDKLRGFQNEMLQLITQQQSERFGVIVTELIAAKSITLLLDISQQIPVLHADESMDITQEVIELMNQKEE